MRAARFGQEVRAVVAVDLTLDELSAVLDGLPVGTDGEAFVFDVEGTVVAAPRVYAGQIAAIGIREGRVASAADLGVAANGAAHLSGAGEVFAQDGDYVILERPFVAAGGSAVVRRVARDSRGTRARARRVGEHRRHDDRGLRRSWSLIAVGLMVRVWGPLVGLRHRATTDAVTGLANRYEFRSYGSRMVASAAAEGAAICVAEIDLDGFKRVNDSFGHKAGDEVLATAGRSLLSATRPRDFVARIGGDEFIVMQRLDADGDSDREVAARVERIRTALVEGLAALSPGGRDVGATVGYVIDRRGGRSLDALLADADAALIAGKAEGKGASYAASTA